MGEESSHYTRVAKEHRARKEAEQAIDRIIREADAKPAKKPFVAADIIEDLERRGWKRG